MENQKMIAKILRTGFSLSGAYYVQYEVNPPIVGHEWDEDYENQSDVPHSFIHVSQVKAPFSAGWETFIFPADANGNVTDYGELPGSRRGFVHPDDLMIELGYEILPQEGETNV